VGSRGTGPSTALWPRIWEVVAAIPAGCVATYGQVAALAGLPRHARLAGYALQELPDGSEVPWHRVINAQGRVSERADLGQGAGFQRHLLEEEGVVFDLSGRVDLRRYRWEPGEIDTLPAGDGSTLSSPPPGRRQRDRRSSRR
jgi:methylated-DNA-protein-cysteine methyltransferase-like protein